MLGVTRRKLQTPGTAEEHKRQETPTSNPIDRQPARLTDQAPRTVERAARETHKTNYHSSCACFTTTATRHHHPHPTGSSPDPLSQRSPLRSLGALHRRAEPHHTTDTTHLSGDTQRPPHLGGPSSGVADGQPRAHGLLLSKGRWRGEGGGGVCSNTDSDAGAGCKCRTWCEGGPAPGPRLQARPSVGAGCPGVCAGGTPYLMA